MEKLLLIAIIILIISVLLYLQKYQDGPMQDSHALGYTQKGDSPEVTLSRIEQVALRHNKISYNIRYVLWSFWIVLFLIIILLDHFPTPLLFAQALFATWFILISLDGYFYWHSDKSSQYIIHQGIKRLRKKFKLKKVKPETLSKPKRDFYNNESPATFSSYAVFNHISVPRN